MALGKPDAGKPPVRFDEGRSQTVIGPRASSTRRLRLLYSSVRVRAKRAGDLRARGRRDYAAFVESLALGLRPGVLRSLARVPPTCAYSVESRPK